MANKNYYKKRVYLSSNQKNDIKKRVAELTAVETEKEIKRIPNLRNLNDRLKQLGKTIETKAKIYYTYQQQAVDILRRNYTVSKYSKTEGIRERVSYFRDKKNGVKQSLKNLNIALAEGYVLIMALREALLDQKIDYRIYVGSEFSDTQVVQIDHIALLDLMDFSSGMYTIKIGEEEITKLQKKNNMDAKELEKLLSDLEEQSKAYQDFFSKIVNDFENGGEFYHGNKNKVRFDVIDTMPDEIRRNLIQKKWAKDLDNHERHRVNFNRGHLAEAFDIAYSQLVYVGKNINNSGKYNYNLLRDPDEAPFYRNLVYDSVKATLGGDNATILDQQFSVKAYSASLYSVSTLYGDLVTLTKMIDLVLEGDPKKDSEIKEYLKSMYLKDDKFDNALVNVAGDTVEKALDRSLNMLKNSK